MKRVFFKELYKNKKKYEKKNVCVAGWIKSNRHNSTIGFIEINDGTTLKNIQLVYDSKDNFFVELSKLLTGSSIFVKGIFIITPNRQQEFEIRIKEVIEINKSEESYPLQKKKHSYEFLREIAHLRSRANIFNALNRIRNNLSMFIHEFLQKRNFIWIHSPIITSNDAEGGGEIFEVIAPKEENFFGKKVFLTVSAQLHAEALALSLGNVYAFSPTFRAEKSHTTIHASEFWMLEPEMAFTDLKDNMKIIESLLKFCIKKILKNCKEEIEFFNKFVDNDLIFKLNNVLKSKFACVTYTKAIEFLKEASLKNIFENNNIYWGMDLKTEHERYISEQIFKKPVFIINYPKEIKAFYMRLNDDKKTVAACDLLVPGIGELVGGSQREERFEILNERIKKINNLDWYLELRKFGCCKHSGFGIGFDRLLMFITGLKNIREVQIFPRNHENIRY